MAFTLLVCSVGLVAAIVVVILEKLEKFSASNLYKWRFAGGEAQFAEATGKVFFSLKEEIFTDFSKHSATVFSMAMFWK